MALLFYLLLLLTLVFAFCYCFTNTIIPSVDYYRTAATLKSSSSHRSPLPFPFRVFWHLGDVGLPAFSMVALEQYERLQKSGLLQVANVSASYLGPQASDMPNLNDSRISMEFMGPASLHEFPTLRKLQSYCALTPQARVLYFHTKGATKSLEDDAVFQRVTEWRYLMEHFLIDLHDTLLRNELSDESPYVTVGTQYRRGNDFPSHYSGNFWMAKCAFINTLSRIDTLDHGNRHLAEFWLATGSEFATRQKNCWTMQKDECEPPGLNLYECTVKRSAYESYQTCRGDSKRTERSLRLRIINAKMK